MPSVNIDDTNITSFEDNWYSRTGSGKRASGRAVREWINGNLKRLSDEQVKSVKITSASLPATLPTLY